MRHPWLLLPILSICPGAALADGNVTTLRTNKGLEIHGDPGDNEFTVTYGKDAQDNDVLVIEGKNGTTINGVPKYEVPLPEGKNAFGLVKVELGAGSDNGSGGIDS